MPQEERAKTVAEFKTDPQVPVLLASSRVASEGYTLTEANHVIFVNQWWNPSANSQARDRVNRIGQERIVYVYNFITVGTIEERLQKLLSDKSNTYADVIGRLANMEVSELKSDLDVIQILNAGSSEDRPPSSPDS
jgi:non-specific serine/threonine protein kinase